MPLPEQGLLSQQQPAAPAPMPTAPAAPAPGGQPAPAPAMGGQPAPAPGGQPAAPPIQSGVPQAERDYQGNPITQKDMDEVDKFSILASKLIHAPETRDKVLGRIKGQAHPYDEIADASLVVIDRIERLGQTEGTPWDQAVKLLGGINVVGQVINLAAAAGKIPNEIPDKDRQVILAQTVQKYYKQKIASGEMTKEQAARDAHLAAQAKAQLEGTDVSQTNQRAVATQKLQNDGANAPDKANLVAQAKAAPGAGLQKPEPAANPMRPQTTMKEALAGGAGGLING